MYVNNWLKSPRAYPVSTIPGEDYPSGGPTVNMFPVWKAAAPAIDLLAPDIYVPNSDRYRSRDGASSTAPTTRSSSPKASASSPSPAPAATPATSSYAVGEGAIGFANFGLDRLNSRPTTASKARCSPWSKASGCSAPSTANSPP